MSVVSSTALADVLDRAALERLAALDPSGANGLVGRVIGAYRSSLLRLVPQLRDGRHAGDADAVRHAAHTLKSSSASVGALRLSQLCADVERRLREDGLAGLDAALDELLGEADRVLDALPPAGPAAR